MSTKLRVLAFLLAVCASFVAIANTAVVFHGALFICLVAPWAYGVSRLLDWVRS